MTPGLTITIVDLDDDYLGIEIQVCNNRYAGSTWIYAGIDELADFAAWIDGFPRDHDDQRSYEFGSRELSMAGGYCSLRFHCLDWAGHAAVEVVLDDDDHRYDAASAQLSLRVEAAGIDQFIEGLLKLQSEHRGSAFLRCL